MSVIPVTSGEEKDMVFQEFRDAELNKVEHGYVKKWC